jgi:hypothetical protein
MISILGEAPGNRLFHVLRVIDERHKEHDLGRVGRSFTIRGATHLTE